jgi:hypothetical protein
MKFDVYYDHWVQYKKLTEVRKTSTTNSTMWTVRVGKIVLHLERYKPERNTNHVEQTRPTRKGDVSSD